MQGSAQLLFVTKVKPDPLDTTISQSDLIAVSSNADYDGKLIAVFKAFELPETPVRRAGYCEAKAKANA